MKKWSKYTIVSPDGIRDRHLESLASVGSKNIAIPDVIPEVKRKILEAIELGQDVYIDADFSSLWKKIWLMYFLFTRKGIWPKFVKTNYTPDQVFDFYTRATKEDILKYTPKYFALCDGEVLGVDQRQKVERSEAFRHKGHSSRSWKVWK